MKILLQRMQSRVLRGTVPKEGPLSTASASPGNLLRDAASWGSLDHFDTLYQVILMLLRCENC